ncbi:MAG: AMP-binding protein, partial [Planctomycetota bacterium]
MVLSSRSSTLQNAPLERVEVSGLEWSPMSVDTGTSKFDLSLSLREENDEMIGRFEYRTDLFLPQTIGRMAAHFCNLVRRLPDQAEQRLSSLSITSEDERNLLDRWGKEPGAPPNSPGGSSATDALRDRTVGQDLADQVDACLSATIDERFCDQVAASPGAIALIHGDRTWTYARLDRESSDWATRLQSSGVGLETAVGVFGDRRPETIIALVAILKAGGAYVPLDRNLPTSRLEWMKQDAKCKIVLDPLTWLVENTERQSDGQRGKGPYSADHAPDQASGPVKKKGAADNLAYIMYTSGSTGLPKGVCTPHRGVTRLVRKTNYAHFGPDEVFLQLAPLGFDASTLEIWGPLLNGGKLVLPKSEQPTLEETAALIEEYRVTTLWLTAGLFHAIMDERPDGLAPVRQLSAGGDVLSMPHLRRANDLLTSTQLVNGYGPTEGT